MNVFITGATGFIGGSIAHRLMQSGHQLTGLVRSEEKAAELRKLGIRPVLGTLDDREVIIKAARSADAVVNAADSDHRGVAETLVSALQGSNKALLHTSGSSIVADYAAGEPSERVFDERIYEEGSTFTPVAELAARVAIDHLVLDAAKRQIRSAVICPCLIYGIGKGLHADSIQVPRLIATAKKGGVARYIGRGLNVWSNVFIDDVVDLFVLSLEKAAAGSFFFAESGEASMKSIAEQISRALGFGGRTQSWPLEEAVREWGSGMSRFGLGSNCRVRGLSVRQILGWKPSEQSLENYLKTIS